MKSIIGGCAGAFLLAFTTFPVHAGVLSDLTTSIHSMTGIVKISKINTPQMDHPVTYCVGQTCYTYYPPH